MSETSRLHVELKVANNDIATTNNSDRDRRSVARSQTGQTWAAWIGRTGTAQISRVVHPSPALFVNKSFPEIQGGSLESSGRSSLPVPDFGKCRHYRDDGAQGTKERYWATQLDKRITSTCMKVYSAHADLIRCCTHGAPPYPRNFSWRTAREKGSHHYWGCSKGALWTHHGQRRSGTWNSSQ